MNAKERRLIQERVSYLCNRMDTNPWCFNKLDIDWLTSLLNENDGVKISVEQVRGYLIDTHGLPS